MKLFKITRLSVCIVLLLLACIVSEGCAHHRPNELSTIEINLQAVDASLGTVTFAPINRTEQIPRQVLAQLSGGIAEPGGKYRESDRSDTRLPLRRLIIGGVSRDYCLLNYEIGGVGKYYIVILLRMSTQDATPIWVSANVGPVISLAQLKLVFRTPPKNEVGTTLW